MWLILGLIYLYLHACLYAWTCMYEVYYSSKYVHLHLNDKYYGTCVYLNSRYINHNVQLYMYMPFTYHLMFMSLIRVHMATD